MSRVWNFSAGPAALPESVLRRAAEEMLDWQGKGLSVMEMSHRSPEYTRIFEKTRDDFRKLLNARHARRAVHAGWCCWHECNCAHEFASRV